MQTKPQKYVELNAIKWSSRFFGLCPFLSLEFNVKSLKKIVAHEIQNYEFIQKPKDMRYKAI